MYIKLIYEFIHHHECLCHSFCKLLSHDQILSTISRRTSQNVIFFHDSHKYVESGKTMQNAALPIDAGKTKTNG